MHRPRDDCSVNKRERFWNELGKFNMELVMGGMVIE